MKDKINRSIRADCKKAGFIPKGKFIFGRAGPDIISGLAIDSPPRATYVWSFVLPRYDNIDFLHLSLGSRFLEIRGNEDYEFETILHGWRSVAGVKNACNLIKYIEEEQRTGDYACWAKFLSLVRIGKFDEAAHNWAMIQTISVLSAARKIDEIAEALECGGWDAVQSLQSKWCGETDKLLKGVPANIVVEC
jgi:hypothetical protein